MANIVIIAGGTGGHIYPGMAVAKALEQAGHSISWMGSKIGMEHDIIADQFPFYSVQVFQLRNRGLAAKLFLPWQLMRAVWQARSILKHIRPAAVIAFGGFVSGPGGLAAKLLGIPLIIHEQNARAGLTNRYLAKLATSKVLSAFPGAFSTNIQDQVIGNPIRQEILALPAAHERLATHTADTLNILVLGGSLGAQAINTAVIEWFSNLRNREDFALLHQAGKANFDAVNQAYVERGIDVDTRAFIDDMPQALMWADLVICRAGALTVSELAAVGVAAIFIPMPHAVDDHQLYNAKYLVDQEAGFLLEQKNLTAEALSKLIQPLLANRDHILTLSQRARALAKRDAVTEVVSSFADLSVVSSASSASQ